MKKNTLLGVIASGIICLISVSPLSAADSKAANTEKYCLFLHTDLPVDVFMRVEEDYLVFRGNATSQGAAEEFKHDVEQGLPPKMKENGITVEIRPYGISQKIEVDSDGKYIRTFSRRNDHDRSVWIRSSAICPEDPKAPFATGVLVRR